MKKVLFLLLFLLNLQVIADYIGVPLDDNALHAQNYSNEGYYEGFYKCYDDGEWYYSSFPCEIEACVTTCPFCHESYPCRDSHLCPIPPAPSDDTWGNDYDDEEEDHEINHDFSGGGGCAGGSTSDNPELISMADFKIDLSITKIRSLPDSLHKQTKEFECAVRAIAFMSELYGHDYDFAYSLMGSIALKHGYDLNGRGIDAKQIHSIFNQYCDILVENYDLRTIDNYIANDKPVGVLVDGGKQLHMVVIIGYDSDFYYTAAGSSKVTVYQKLQLGINNKIYTIKNIPSPYKCKRKTY